MKYQVGDVVHLKSGMVSGSPPFTVLECHEAGELPERYGVCCLAVDGSNLLTFILPEVTLVRPEDAS